MYRDLILKSGNSQRFTSKLFDNSPKTKAIMLLGLHLDRILQDPDTPFLFQVWPLPHHFIFEVCSQLRKDFQDAKQLRVILARSGPT